MVIKNKQKGGEDYKIPNNLIDYFISLIELLEIYNRLIKHLINFRVKAETQNNYNNKKKIINELKNKLTELETKESSYLLTDICINLQISVNPPLKDIKNLENLIINSILLILNSLFSSRNINNTDNFISKMLKIYTHKLFIDFWYTKLITNDNYKKIVQESLILLKYTPKINKNYVNSFIDNSNRFFNNQNRRFYSIKILPLIKEIRRMFLTEYPFGIPIFYGNINHGDTGYNEFICKIVGVSSTKKRRFIINPLSELICMLMLIIQNYKIENYIEELNILLYKLLQLDDTFNGFPNIEHLQYGTRFCIIKDENNNESVNTQEQSKCSIVYGCSLIMSAEIRKENIASDEDIFDFLDILLRIILINKDAIIEFFIKHRSQNVKISQIEHRIQNVNKRTHNKYFEGIIELLYNLKNLKNKITQMQNLKNKNGITNSRIIQEQNNARNRIISIFINNILQLPESNIPELQKLQNDVKSSISQSNRKLLQSFTSKIINKILDLIILNPEIKKEFDYFLEKNHMKKMKINSIYQPQNISY